MTTVAVPPVPARPASPPPLPAEEFTAEAYLAHPASRERTELVRGRVRPRTPSLSPSNQGHSAVADNLLVALAVYAKSCRLGRAFGNDAGYILSIPGDAKDSVRAPDVSFVAADRLPPEGLALRGLLRRAPDLAVEVLSPDQTAAEMDERIADYLAAGTRLFWMIDPFRRTVAAYSPHAPVRWLRAGDLLDGADAVPGFTMPVDDLFDGLAPA